MATVATTIKKVWVSGDRKRVVADITLTGTYTVGGDQPAGGYAKALGLEFGLDGVAVTGPAKVTGGQVGARYDDVNDKIQLYGNSDGTAAVNELSPELTAVAIPGGPATVRVEASGKGSAAVYPPS